MKKSLFILLGTIIFQFCLAQAPINIPDSKGAGNGLLLNGSGDFINCGSGASLDNIWEGGGTAMVWANVTSDGGNNVGRLLAKRTETHGWTLVTRNDDGSNVRLQFQSQTSGGTATVDLDYRTDNRVVPLGRWTHIAVTYDKDDFSNLPTIYVNGEIVSGADNSDPPAVAMANDQDASFRIGKMEYLSGRTYHGYVDEVSLWTRELSQDEIKNYMCTKLAGTELGLVGYWDMNEGIGGTISDLTINGNDGTLDSE